MVSVTPRLLFTPGKDLVPIVQEAGWAPGPVWTGVENLAPTGIQSLDRPPSSQSLYRLRCPAHMHAMSMNQTFVCNWTEMGACETMSLLELMSSDLRLQEITEVF